MSEKPQDRFGNPVGADLAACKRCGGYGGVITGVACNHEPEWESCDVCCAPEIPPEDR